MEHFKTILISAGLLGAVALGGLATGGQTIEPSLMLASAPGDVVSSRTVIATVCSEWKSVRTKTSTSTVNIPTCIATTTKQWVEYDYASTEEITDAVFELGETESNVRRISENKIAVYGQPIYRKKADGKVYRIKKATTTQDAFSAQTLSIGERLIKSAWADTTNATNAGSSAIVNVSPTTNTSADNYLYSGMVGPGGSTEWRSVLAFTLPSDLGTIDSVKMYLYRFEKYDNTGGFYNYIYNCTRTFVEAEVTWNIWSTGNNWTTAGGDISGGTLGSFPINTTAVNTWENSTITGTYAWSTRYNFLMKSNATVGSNNYVGYRSADHTTQPAYLEITYTPSGGGAVPFVDENQIYE